MSEIRLARPLLFDSIVDGPGLRCVIWTQGCSHHCAGCHNPQTHDVNGGYLMSIDDIVEGIKAQPSQNGITISGGEPMVQCDVLLELVSKLRTLTSSMWLYTGYTLEELLDELHPDFDTRMRILSYLDVLVDGEFIREKRDTSLLFRGSANQRIIDINQTAWNNGIVLWRK